MVRKRDNASFPDKKISETILDYAAPLLEAVGVGATREKIEHILKIAVTVWNSVVFDTINGNTHYISRIRQLSADDPVSVAVVEIMISRKKALFPRDQRLTGEYRLMGKKEMKLEKSWLR